MDIRPSSSDLCNDDRAVTLAGPIGVATAVPSPCTSVCSLDPATGWCVGCLRTIDEIAAWGRLDDAGKGTVLMRLPSRRAECARRGIATAPLVAGDDVES